MNKEILRLAIPNIISNISVPLLSTVDTALMGRMSALHIGAVGVGAMIFNFVYWNFGFLRMGTTGITAQAYGQQDDAAIIHTLGRALLVALVLAMLVLILQVPLGELGLYLMNTTEQQAPLLRQYYYIRVWAAPATLGLYVLMGWFFGMQNAIYPMILTIVINVVNILLSFMLVHYAHMDVDGVAYGTLIAQYVGLLLGLILFYHKYAPCLAHYRQRALLEWEHLRRFMTLNRDIFLRTFCLTFSFGFFYSQSATLGENLLAINVILLQFLNWMSYGIDGFAFAAESLVGKYVGARNEAATRRAIRLSFRWGGLLAIAFSLTYGLLGPFLLQIFTDQLPLIEQSMPYLFWMILFPLISFACYVWDGIFVGLMAAVAMRNAMILSLGFYLLAHFALIHYWGNHGLWLALLLFMAIRGILQGLLFRWKGLALR
ncbi:MAG: MATE family efflux transporter [Bacteroidota bacterium]